MIRRYIYDPAVGAVVEVGQVRPGISAVEEFNRAEQEYRADDANPHKGETLRAASLERAGRREFAYARYGDERRWAE